jgi:UDP-GlcNAc:undecaprenyl-phosphate/decaprenyl-phosphate GlcNAc-1-phosphate transferase
MFATVAVAFVVALFLTPVARRLGVATGLVDRPSDPALAIHMRPVPLLGGPAVVAAAFAGVVLLGDGVPWSIVAAALVALGTGLVDDIHPLPPLLRLALHAGAGVILAVDGLGIEPLGALAGAGVVLLVLACANAVNMIDGQNGLAGGLIAASAAGLAMVHPDGHQARAIGLALAGAAVAFLVWNVPGRIFLGNGGAYVAGALLAALAASASAEGWRGLLAAGACLGVFAFETVFTVARRARTGAGLMTGDRQHSYDIVAERSGSRLRSTYRFWAAGAIAAALGYAVSRMDLVAGAALAGVFAGCATAAGVRIWVTRPRTNEKLGG